jgi:hemerythrin superfamily protein
MKTAKNTPSQAGTAQPDTAGRTKDAIGVLTDDHRTVQRLFDAFRKADDTDLDRKGTLVRRACEELTIHAMVEEKLLYPAAQESLDDEDKPDVEEAFVEHYLVKMLIEKFVTLKPGEKGFDATFKVLMEMVEHHIEEEESELFPELKKSHADLEALGAAIMKEKTALEAKLPKDAGDRTMQLH